MSKFFEKYLKNENVDNVDCAREDINKNSKNSHKKEENVILYSRVQSTKSTKLSVVENESIDTKHKFPACLNCLSYSWKADGNLMKPWCKKINTGVFELMSCPESRWKKTKAIIN